mgnify:CR=1 FL=1
METINKIILIFLFFEKIEKGDNEILVKSNAKAR